MGRRLDSASLGGRGDCKTSSTRHLPTWKVETAQFPWQAVGLRVPQQWRRPCRRSCRTVRRRTTAGPGSPCLVQSPRTLPVALHKVFRSGLGHSPPPGPLASGIVLIHAFPGVCVGLGGGMCSSLPVVVLRGGHLVSSCWGLHSILMRPGHLCSSCTTWSWLTAADPAQFLTKDCTVHAQKCELTVGDRPLLKERDGACKKVELEITVCYAGASIIHTCRILNSELLVV